MCSLLSAATAAAALEVPMSVTNRTDWPRHHEFASGGVPLPMGALKDETQLRVVDVAGKYVPAQFTVLNHWPGDGSIRWVLVQFPVEIAAKQTLKFTLKRGRYLLPGIPWALALLGAITISSTRA